MMDHEEDGEVAINLSTNQAPRSADTPNGNAEPEDGEPQVSALNMHSIYIAIYHTRKFELKKIYNRF